MDDILLEANDKGMLYEVKQFLSKNFDILLEANDKGMLYEVISVTACSVLFIWFLAQVIFFGCIGLFWQIVCHYSRICLICITAWMSSH